MKIVTSGSGPTDIDALSSAVAYANLLRLKGEKASIYLNQAFTVTITPEIRDWPLPLTENPGELDADSEIVLVDFSDPEKLLPGLSKEKIVKVIDHHFFGQEKEWKLRLQDQAIIEPVGSCASLVWREYKEAGMLERLDPLAAKLMYVAIISNTLNLQASITALIDREAAHDLAQRSGLDEEWIARYYSQIESELLKDPIGELKKDTRIYEIKGKRYVIGQLELWDGNKFLQQSLPELHEFISSYETGHTSGGFITIPSIRDGHNYIIPRDEASSELLGEIIKPASSGDHAITNKLYLRKELIKLLNEQ